MGNPQLLNELQGRPIVIEGHPWPPPIHTHTHAHITHTHARTQDPLISPSRNPINEVKRWGWWWWGGGGGQTPLLKHSETHLACQARLETQRHLSLHYWIHFSVIANINQEILCFGSFMKSNFFKCNKNSFIFHQYLLNYPESRWTDTL